MRKYKYLNKDEAHRSKVAYGMKDIANKYIFQRSSLEISYLVCDDIEEFYTYYSAKSSSSRMHSEVINDSFSSQKLKIDIDGRIGDDEMAYMLKVVKRLFRRLTKICKPELLVYDISTSHHIVVANIAFPTAACCEILANIICEKVSKRYPVVASLIDVGVYKKVQMFRVEGSTKYGQRRWKYLDGTKKLSPVDIFKKGIISYVDDCYIVDADIVSDIALETGIYKPIGCEPERQVTTRHRRVPKEFVVRKIMGNLTILDRISPSHCTICKRMHDKDGAYLVGDRFFCRRY